MGVRPISRAIDVDPHTVLSLLISAGRAGATYHDVHVRNVSAKRVQCDELWSFVYAKAKNVKDAKAAPEEAGDVWTWIALDPDSKLIVSYLTGGRGTSYGKMFMKDLAGRLSGRVQLITDQHPAYPPSVEGAFGKNVDFEFGDAANSFVERQNLTIRTSVKRFARKTNAHSKKLENHVASVHLHVLHYNWCRYHETIRCAPAMEAGLSKTLHDVEWIAELADSHYAG